MRSKRGFVHFAFGAVGLGSIMNRVHHEGGLPWMLMV